MNGRCLSGEDPAARNKAPQTCLSVSYKEQKCETHYTYIILFSLQQFV